MYRSKLYLSLLHYPVKNKDGRDIAAAVTSIDLHDIARAARTFGAAGFYVITPLADQREFAGKIIGHWVDGAGSRHNPDRGDALSLIRIREDLAGAVHEIGALEKTGVRVVATSAAGAPGQMEFAELRGLLEAGRHAYLLVLGTAWGLSEEFMENADARLAPIAGNCDYNHLSVRSAAAIMLDRLMGGQTG
ncbi:MAG: RNA methyltransferase [Desulfosalsimonas sp.]